MQYASVHAALSAANRSDAQASQPDWMQDLEAATARVLTEGGDARIALNATGCNAYGCRPFPHPALVQFGSATGSVISEAGFRAAANLYKRLLEAPYSYRFEVERQRQQLAQLSGASGVPGSQLVLAASGTDVHRYAAHLAAQGDALLCVLVEAAETGSAVPQALAAQPTPLAPGVFGKPKLSLCQGAPALVVALRRADASLRTAGEVDDDFAEQVGQAVATGKRCLLVLTDVSKSGLLAPTPACAQSLQQRYGAQLSVLVDACQYRISQQTLARYLSDGFMVAITGSKFIGGPAFCGALILPAALSERYRRLSLHGLRAASIRSNWPANWLAATALPVLPNLGLALRWEAALLELQRFRAIGDVRITDFLHHFGQALHARLARDAAFEALPVAPLLRAGASASASWDQLQTIFPFLLYRRLASGERRPLQRDKTAQLYRQLQTRGSVSERFLLAQPVHCGENQGVPVSALRLCASARLVSHTLACKQDSAAAIAQAMRALDRVALLAQSS